MYEITLSLLKAVAPSTKDSTLLQYVEPLNVMCKHYGITATKERLAGFLAQVSHESGGFMFVKENLNYSAAGLQTTFKKYFPTNEVAIQYARKPQAIANKVYGNRMGNGPESSGDGARYCGRGLIQLTGKNNYSLFAKDLGISLDECVDFLSTIPGIVSSAGWFWDSNNLNTYCDKNDFIGLTKKINGGTIGLVHRTECYNAAMKELE